MLEYQIDRACMYCWLLSAVAHKRQLVRRNSPERGSCAHVSVSSFSVPNALLRHAGWRLAGNLIALLVTPTCMVRDSPSAEKGCEPYVGDECGASLGHRLIRQAKQPLVYYRQASHAQPWGGVRRGHFPSLFSRQRAPLNSSTAPWAATLHRNHS